MNLAAPPQPFQITIRKEAAFQSAYLAHWLTRAGTSDEGLTRTIASARLDLNPHQIEAALFALRSPISLGVLLADEVGLGKTIEAGLVLAQRWAEHRRKLLLIVPATLRKQWSVEIAQKFLLPSRILEAKPFNEAVKAGLGNPFLTNDIVICSYEFAATKERYLAQVPWDLVVMDEAHKLRNVYKSEGAKTARKLESALRHRPKVLLSATPLQNNLLELYGLMSIIDPYFFGDLNSFKARYGKPKLDAEAFESLRERLKHACSRTLRRQVQETGGIRFTRRYSITEDFTPSTEELELYDQVSSYLQDPEITAIKPKARHLVILVIRKILASSSYAIQGTLETIIDRLENSLPIEDVLEDFETAEDFADVEFAEQELEESPDERSNSVNPTVPQYLPIANRQALQRELELLRKFKLLAEQIHRNAKADALIRVLVRAFEMTERLGGARKAVIFTESMRTQHWLAQLLAQQGYAGKIALLNGSNADADSRATYQQWKDKHAGTARISGSRSADMKAAIVERFAEQAEILICTEAGAEGINLQFCSLLINYDLPWNPQRVEQRIGRVHRYGQKNDVVVVNFINKGNRADQRVFELLSQKFQLFEGVFGASDEILGSIESGIDIERHILEIYQRCRSDAEIDEEFERLRERFKSHLEVRENDIRRSIFENLDQDVVRRLKLRRDTTDQQLNDYQQHLLNLARLMLPEAEFTDDAFYWQGRHYDARWPLAVERDSVFFQPQEGLGEELLRTAKAGVPAESLGALEFDLGAPGIGQLSFLKHHPVPAGELIVEKLTLKTERQISEHLIVVAIDDDGAKIPQAVAERLLHYPARSLDSSAAFSLNQFRQLDPLEAQLDLQIGEQLGKTEQANEQFLLEETTKLEQWAEDRRVALDLRIKELDAAIKEQRKAARQIRGVQLKIEAQRQLKQLERERDRVMLDYHEEKKRIEAEEDELLAKVEAALQLQLERTRLFTLRWSLKRP